MHHAKFWINKLTMRSLIADVYKILYRLTGKKLFSFSFAVSYISVLNLFILYGLSYILVGLVPHISMLAILFRARYILLPILLVFGIDFLMMLPLQNLSKDKNRPYKLAPILVFSFASILLFLYARYGDKIMG